MNTEPFTGMINQQPHSQLNMSTAQLKGMKQPTTSFPIQYEVTVWRENHSQGCNQQPHYLIPNYICNYEVRTTHGDETTNNLIPNSIWTQNNSRDETTNNLIPN